jgi:hypothetical protein
MFPTFFGAGNEQLHDTVSTGITSSYTLSVAFFA